MKQLTLGSLFDGIGGWQVAAIKAGIKPIWSSEIDPFPMAVTKHHFPNTKQLGDITKIDVDKLEPVDIVCAGSPCFVAGTSIQTIHGIKPIEEVEFGDQVIGDDCDWHTVIKTMINPTDAIYTIKAQGLLETIATANHPIYVRHMKRHYPTYENGKRGNERVFSEPEYVAVKDLQKGDFVGFPILKSSENVCKITEEEAWLVGRYIADGYVNNSPRKDRPSTNHKVIFCIGKGKVENFKAHIDKYHVCLKKDATCTKGEIISDRLMGLCLMCGKGAGNKEIPSIFLDLPKDLLKVLIDGYMSGDGCKTKKRNQATTISKKLALSLQVAVHKAYQVPVKIYFCKRPSKGFIQGREINQHDTYCIAWIDTIPKQSNAVVINDYIWQPIRSVTKEDIQTTVYNLEVEGVHSYVANGIMTHNCQDLSVAGKREGLAGERSGLFRTAIDIVHRLRDRTGLPRYFVWENVPGAFSSNKGFDFKAVLEEITKTEIPMPSGNKWAEAGLVEWGGCCQLAWRCLDAQHWGVPQRRKRIFLVADFAGQSAGEILFVESGLPWDSEESREAGEGTATTIEGSTNKASGFKYRNGSRARGIGYEDEIVPTLERSQNTAVLRMRSGCPGGGKGPLVSEEKSLTLATNNDQVLFDKSQIGWDAYQHHNWKTAEQFGTLTAENNNHVRGDTPLVMDNNPAGGDTVGALQARDYKGSCNQWLTENKLIMSTPLTEPPSTKEKTQNTISR